MKWIRVCVLFLNTTTRNLDRSLYYFNKNKRTIFFPYYSPSETSYMVNLKVLQPTNKFNFKNLRRMHKYYRNPRISNGTSINNEIA